MLLRFAPVLRGELVDRAIGGVGQPGEHVAQVGERIDTAAATAFDDGVEDGAALASVGGTDEQPVLFAQGGGPDGVFDQVVVNLEATVVEINAQQGPLGEGIVEGLAKVAARQVTPGHFAALQRAVDPREDRDAVAGADRGAQARSRLGLAQVCLDAVKQADLAQQPLGAQGRLLAGLVEVTPSPKPRQTRKSNFLPVLHSLDQRTCLAET